MTGSTCGVVPTTDKEYYVRGNTALLDAVGKTINKIGNAKKRTAEEERAEHVIFVIITDGIENASREFSYERVRTFRGGLKWVLLSFHQQELNRLS